jgi:predicted DNA-binding protein with PD1-like motif
MDDETGFHAAAGRFGQIVPLRLATGTDITDGIRGVCQAHGIRHAAILTGIGSLRKMTYQVLAPAPGTALGAAYTPPRVIQGPVEVLSLQGVIFESEQGEPLLHIHGTFSDQHGQVYAGHVVAGENPVLATLDGVIAELADVRLVRRNDPRVGLGLCTPESRQARPVVPPMSHPPEDGH